MRKIYSSPAERARAWRAKNPDRVRQAYQRFKERHPVKAAEASRKHHLKERYGITPEQFRLLKKQQNHRCAVCEKKKPLCVDHCHQGGQVRMLLCRTCNSGIGYLNDDPVLLMKAASLLLNPPAANVLRETNA